jgi:hypothetical protein
MLLSKRNVIMFYVRARSFRDDGCLLLGSGNTVVVRPCSFASMLAEPISFSFMYLSVAARAECQQIFRSVIAQIAPCLNVMDLKILHRTAGLAAPPVTHNHRSPQSAIGMGIEANSRTFWLKHSQEALSRFSRNCCFCGDGKSLKRRSKASSSILASPFSMLTPARKSAQIISRQ